MTRHGCKTTQANSSGHVTCAVCSIQRRPNVHNVHQEDLGGKELLEAARQTSLTKAKKDTATKKGKHANQWQADASKFGKTTKGKGKAAYQWQQQNAANEWYIDQGTKNGGNRTGWQQSANQGQYQGRQAQQIHGVGPPNQRAADPGVQADAFVRAGQQGPEQPTVPIITNAGQPQQAGVWHQHQDPAALPAQKVQEADEISEPELVDEV